MDDGGRSSVLVYAHWPDLGSTTHSMQEFCTVNLSVNLHSISLIHVFLLDRCNSSAPEVAVCVRRLKTGMQNVGYTLDRSE